MLFIHLVEEEQSYNLQGHSMQGMVGYVIMDMYHQPEGIREEKSYYKIP